MGKRDKKRMQQSISKSCLAKCLNLPREFFNLVKWETTGNGRRLRSLCELFYSVCPCHLAQRLSSKWKGLGIRESFSLSQWDAGVRVPQWCFKALWQWIVPGASYCKPEIERGSSPGAGNLALTQVCPYWQQNAWMLCDGLGTCVDKVKGIMQKVDNQNFPIAQEFPPYFWTREKEYGKTGYRMCFLFIDTLNILLYFLWI